MLLYTSCDIILLLNYDILNWNDVPHGLVIMVSINELLTGRFYAFDILIVNKYTNNCLLLQPQDAECGYSNTVAMDLHIRLRLPVSTT